MKKTLYQNMFYILILTVGLCIPLETKTKLNSHFFTTAGIMIALGYMVHYIDQYTNNSAVSTEDKDILTEEPTTLKEIVLHFIKKYIAQPLPQVLGITNNIATIAAGSYALVS